MLDSQPFLIVGGLGGSGTRVVAALIQHFGVHLGYDLNEQFDNLTYTLLFKRRQVLGLPEAEIVQDLRLLAGFLSEGRKTSPADNQYLYHLASVDRPQHESPWLQQRVLHLRQRELSANYGLTQGSLWGLKEPNSHVLLPYFAKAFPDVRYVHVARNGLDMAFSENKNQLRYWADEFLGDPQCSGEISESRQLRYWCAVQKRAIKIGATMDGRFYLLNYDKLCAEPETEVAKLVDFLTLDVPKALFESSLKLIYATQASRFKGRDMGQFDRASVDYVASLGFTIA